jgi:hypothetical protein
MDKDDVLQLPLLEAKEKITRIRKVLVDTLPSNEELKLPLGEPRAEFVEDILQRGQRESIQVVQFPDGKQWVEAGRKRIATFRILKERFPEQKKWNRIRTEIADAEDFMSALMAAAASNNQRHANVLTDLQAIRYCMDHFPDMKDTEISRMTGIHPSTLKSRKKLFSLQPKWWDLFEGGNLLTGTAVEISKQTPEVQNNLWATYMQNDRKITKEDIINAQRVRREETITEHQAELFPDLEPIEVDEPDPLPDPSLCPYCGQDMP